MIFRIFSHQRRIKPSCRFVYSKMLFGDSKDANCDIFEIQFSDSRSWAPKYDVILLRFIFRVKSTKSELKPLFLKTFEWLNCIRQLVHRVCLCFNLLEQYRDESRNFWWQSYHCEFWSTNWNELLLANNSQFWRICRFLLVNSWYDYTWANFTSSVSSSVTFNAGPSFDGSTKLHEWISMFY